MSHFGVDYHHPTKEPQYYLPNLAPPKREMTSSLSWTSLFKSPTPRPLSLGDPTLAKLNQVIPEPKDIFNKHLLTELLSMCETESCVTKSIPFCDPGVHTGTTFLVKLTEKPEDTQQGQKMSHNDGTRLFSGFLVCFASGVVKTNVG